MTEENGLITVHSLLHKAEQSRCTTDWSEMYGDDVSRLCPDCGTLAIRVNQMDPDDFCNEAEKHKKINHLDQLRTYRRADGTYTFNNRACTPKKLLAPMRSDCRSVAVTTWWSQRLERYNKYLLKFGLVVGGITTAVAFLTPAGFGALIAFVIYGIICALMANIAFVAGGLTNLLIPGFLQPVRQYAGPILLTMAMIASGVIILSPLITLVCQFFGRF